MTTPPLSLVLTLLAMVALTCAANFNSTSVGGDVKRVKKALSVFQVVRFNNDPCMGGVKNGTCYTAAECEQRGGNNAGTCADGFGVCCTLTIGCGQQSNENCTYFDSSGTTAGGCSATVCPCNDNICQMRLDFVSFVIAGPSTSTTSVTQLSNGVAGGATTSVTEATRCNTDSFSVSQGGGGVNPPTICGTNTGEHMYVDAAGQNCNDLSFLFGNEGIDTTIPTRAFSIKVSQYSCEYANLAPTGCTQYFFGSNTNQVQTYNYNSGNGKHLANQDQQICVRRERGNCRICWYAQQLEDFNVNGMAAKSGIIDATVCCDGHSTKGYDCLVIPGAQKSVTPFENFNSHICGGGGGLVTANQAAATTMHSKSICSTMTPFMVAFRSDAWEEQTMENMQPNTGFTLEYTMDATNC